MTRRKTDQGPRCGHTQTAVAAVGEEGSPGYIGPRLILFGGATTLEGNSAAPQAYEVAFSYILQDWQVSLQMSTADVHCLDIIYNKWSRLHPLGDPPSPRAAHAATAGGIGPTGVSTEDLHVLDLTQARPRWHRVVVKGLAQIHGMGMLCLWFLLCIGGNDGKWLLADVWALDTAAKPYEWRQLEREGDGPPPCVSVLL